MKVYELMERLSVMPAGLEVKADTMVPVDDFLDTAEAHEEADMFCISGTITKVEPRPDNSITICFEWEEVEQE